MKLKKDVFIESVDIYQFTGDKKQWFYKKKVEKNIHSFVHDVLRMGVLKKNK